MAISVERYAALKKAIDQDRRGADMARGALAEVMKSLRAKGHKSLDAAKKALTKEKAELAEMEERLETMVEELEAKYGDKD